MSTATVSAAEMRIKLRLTKLAEAEHWNITGPLLGRIIREAGHAADQKRPVDIIQPGKSQKARAARIDALDRMPAPTVEAIGECHLADGESPVGWRLYVHEGWQPVCTRHMGGAKAVGRRFNRELGSQEFAGGAP